jgi:hypothetical protein
LSSLNQRKKKTELIGLKEKKKKKGDAFKSLGVQEGCESFACSKKVLCPNKVFPLLNITHAQENLGEKWAASRTLLSPLTWVKRCLGFFVRFFCPSALKATHVVTWMLALFFFF